MASASSFVLILIGRSGLSAIKRGEAETKSQAAHICSGFKFSQTNSLISEKRAFPSSKKSAASLKSGSGQAAVKMFFSDEELFGAKTEKSFSRTFLMPVSVSISNFPSVCPFIRAGRFLYKTIALVFIFVPQNKPLRISMFKISCLQ